MIDYYINRTASLMNVEANLKDTLADIQKNYCNKTQPSTATISQNVTTNASTPKTVTPNATVTTSNTTIVADNSTATIATDSTSVSTSNAPGTQAADKTKQGSSEESTISVFTQRLQQIASQYGLSADYVQTKLRKCRTNKIRSKLKH